MHPTSLAGRFQAARNDAISSVTLATLYLDVLMLVFEKHMDYERAITFLHRLRRRNGEHFPREACRFSALEDWERRQSVWRSWDEHAVTLEGSTYEGVAVQVFESFDNPNEQGYTHTATV